MDSSYLDAVVIAAAIWLLASTAATAWLLIGTFLEYRRRRHLRQRVAAAVRDGRPVVIPPRR